MTELYDILSPKAYNVVSAVWESADTGDFNECDIFAFFPVIAAALRSAGDEVAPTAHDYTHGSLAELEWRGRRLARTELLAIATELENFNE